MRVTLFAFGKLKTAGLRETADYYAKLASSWIDFEEVELKPLSVPDKSPANRVKIQEQEAKILLDRIEKMDSRAVIYLLDETGRVQSTQEWANQVRDWERGSPHVIFCIGSSLGFHESVGKRARARFSLGAQTLSHELARVVLLEQLFRAWSVTRGHPYHNEG